VLWTAEFVTLKCGFGYYIVYEIASRKHT